ncbi:ligand-gated channel [Nitrospira sp. KM1]|uniref:TonB-dependent siderophore receptor n=1 Tax=Nitrospira sp. KM1 TaxID=1936990 RepID=UPI0013A74E45|nr:TonB-dependent receptor [Nitrospira sp. KM1]BCA56541.1 ligand-gated channel [Nitrospira sp. KM1]
MLQQCVGFIKRVRAPWLIMTGIALVPALWSTGAGAQEHAFSIGPQPLNKALIEYATQAGVSVNADPEILEGRQTMGVTGQFSNEAALQQLLQGTGLQLQQAGANTFTILPAAVVPMKTPHGSAEKPVKVPEILVKEVRARDESNSYVAEEASTATRTDTPLIQVPQSIEVVTRKVMDDQRAIRVEQALRNVSGVNIGYTAQGRAANDTMFCRGFPCAFFKDNMRNDDFVQAFAFRDVANIQRLEVLKGPASVLYGRSEPGGIINIMTKQPQADRYASIEQIVGSYNYYRTMLDATGPLDEGKKFLYRINGAYENTESFRDLVHGQRYFVSPVFLWKAGNNTSVTIEGEYIRDRMSSDAGLPAIGRSVAPLPRSRFLGEPFDTSGVEEGRVSLRVNHRFSDAWRIESQIRIDESTISGHFTNPIAVQANNTTLTRNVLDQLADTSSYYWRNDVIGKVATGSIKHEILTGVELGRQSSSLDRAQAPFGSINIYNPIYNQFLVPPLNLTRFARSFANAVGGYVQDQIALTDNLFVLAGARGDYFYQHSTVAGGDTKAENWGFSPRIGVTYQPLPAVAFYANVTRSFQPTFGPFAAVSNLYLPTTGTQYEAGMKTDIVPGRLTSTIAVYRIDKKNVLAVDPTNFLLQIQTGGQRSQGVELDLAAQLTDAWKVIATYAYTDARVTADTTIQVGNRLPLISRNTASFWTTYDFLEGPLKGFGTGAGVFIAGERAGDINNSFELPGYVRTDAALYYRKNEIFDRTNLVAQLNFQNLLNQDYYYGGFQTRGSAGFPGAPLSVLGSIKFEFF